MSIIDAIVFCFSAELWIRSVIVSSRQMAGYCLLCKLMDCVKQRFIVLCSKVHRVLCMWLLASFELLCVTWINL